jgi:hypothetical protein
VSDQPLPARSMVTLIDAEVVRPVPVSVTVHVNVALAISLRAKPVREKFVAAEDGALTVMRVSPLVRTHEYVTVPTLPETLHVADGEGLPVVLMLDGEILAARAENTSRFAPPLYT